MGMKSATTNATASRSHLFRIEAAASEAALEAEKQKARSGAKRKGMYGTILTSGTGVEDEATTSKSLLGGTKY
jgi:hypothetical protein